MLPKKTLKMSDHNQTEIMPEDTSNEVEHTSIHISIGTVLNNKYKTIDVIEENTGEATLFICENNSRKFVAKVYHRNKKPKLEILEKARQLHSPNIIPIVDHGELSNRYFEILPYYRHGDLLKAAPLESEVIKRIIVPSINEGLYTLHSQGIIHRDIKPDNLFITDDEEDIVIGDFGISSYMEERLTVRRTSASRTLGYSAPETTQGFVSKESDYYSLGITLLYLATGVDPFADMTDEQIIKITLTDKLQIPEMVDKSLAHLIRGLTLKERKDRFGYEEVKGWINGDEIPINEIMQLPPTNISYHFKGQEYNQLDKLVLAFAENWDEAIKHLRRGFISDYVKSFRQDLASELIDVEEEERDNDIALFKMIYLLSPEAPLYWKGEVFTDLLQLSESIKKQIPNQNQDYIDLLQKGMLQLFIDNRSSSADLKKEVGFIQTLAQKNPVKAYYKLYYLLSNEESFVFEQNCFRSVDELVEFLYEQRERVEDISKQLLDQPYFFAWLEKLGYEDFITEWKKIKYD